MCAKLHPSVCGNSLDLKCLDNVCPLKLHVLKYRRSEIHHPENLLRIRDMPMLKHQEVRVNILIREVVLK